jgi:hypothetical protein
MAPAPAFAPNELYAGAKEHCSLTKGRPALGISPMALRGPKEQGK